MSRRTAILAALIGLAALLLRLPFVTHVLWQWDSVLYARALEHGFHVDYVLADSRPHPPGYILYVALAALFRAMTHDSNAALVAVSILATGLATAAVFVLATRFADMRVAALVAAGFAANPLVWLYGDVAYPYLLLAFLSVALAGLFREVRSRGPRARVLASAAFGIAAGFRQDLLLVLLPLWLWMLWRGSAREGLAHLAAVGAASLVWFLPSALLSDGILDYLDSVRRQTQNIGEAYSVAQNGIEALAYNLLFTLNALASGLLGFGALLVVVFVGAAARWLRGGASRVAIAPDATFFLLWLVPALLVFVVVHIGEWGHILAVLPGLYVLAGMLLPRLRRAFSPLPRLAGRAAWAGAAAGLVLVPAASFVLQPDARFSAAALRAHDVAVSTKFAYVREHFPPDATIILAREDYLHVQHYLPEYKAWFYDPEPHDKQANTKKRVSRGPKTVVLFTDGLQPMRPRELTDAEAAPGVTLRYFVVEPTETVEFIGERFGIGDGLRH